MARNRVPNHPQRLVDGDGRESAVDPAEDADRQAFLSTSPAGRRARRLTVMVAVLSSVGFVAAVPLAPVQLAKIPAFIPSYESALGIID